MRVSDPACTPRCPLARIITRALAIWKTKRRLLVHRTQGWRICCAMIMQLLPTLHNQTARQTEGLELAASCQRQNRRLALDKASSLQ